MSTPPGALAYGGFMGEWGTTERIVRSPAVSAIASVERLLLEASERIAQSRALRAQSRELIGKVRSLRGPVRSADDPTRRQPQAAATRTA